MKALRITLAVLVAVLLVVTGFGAFESDAGAQPPGGPGQYEPTPPYTPPTYLPPPKPPKPPAEPPAAPPEDPQGETTGEPVPDDDLDPETGVDTPVRGRPNFTG